MQFCRLDILCENAKTSSSRKINVSAGVLYVDLRNNKKC